METTVYAGTSFVFCDAIYKSPDDAAWWDQKPGNKVNLTWAKDVTECGADERGVWTTQSSREDATDDFLMCSTAAPKFVFTLCVGPIAITGAMTLLIAAKMWRFQYGTVPVVILQRTFLDCGACFSQHGLHVHSRVLLCDSMTGGTCSRTRISRSLERISGVFAW